MRLKMADNYFDEHICRSHLLNVSREQVEELFKYLVMISGEVNHIDDSVEVDVVSFWERMRVWLAPTPAAPSSAVCLSGAAAVCDMCGQQIGSARGAPSEPRYQGKGKGKAKRRAPWDADDDDDEEPPVVKAPRRLMAAASAAVATQTSLVDVSVPTMPLPGALSAVTGAVQPTTTMPVAAGPPTAGPSALGDDDDADTTLVEQAGVNYIYNLNLIN